MLFIMAWEVSGILLGKDCWNKSAHLDNGGSILSKESTYEGTSSVLKARMHWGRRQPFPKYCSILLHLCSCNILRMLLNWSKLSHLNIFLDLLAVIFPRFSSKGVLEIIGACNIICDCLTWYHSHMTISYDVTYDMTQWPFPGFPLWGNGDLKEWEWEVEMHFRRLAH